MARDEDPTGGTRYNDLAWWWPRLEAAGLPTPRTKIMHSDGDLLELLDGELPPGFEDMVTQLQVLAHDVGGPPVFLRTGYLSGKHSWARTCYVHDLDVIGYHVAALVEESACAGVMGLPTDTWAVREMLDTAVLFRCTAWEGFPVAREFRCSVGHDPTQAEQAFGTFMGEPINGVVVHPYWPEAAVEEGQPYDPNWRAVLHAASTLEQDELHTLGALAVRAGEALGGGWWSVDCLQVLDGRWYITDVAIGEESWWPGMRR